VVQVHLGPPRPLAPQGDLACPKGGSSGVGPFALPGTTDGVQSMFYQFPMSSF